VNSAEVEDVFRTIRPIDGWFSLEAAQLFGLLDAVQVCAGVVGDLFEIGVHHGRSAVLLCHMAQAGERVRVCDLFDAQSENVSGSGRGDRALFEQNIRALAPASIEVEIFHRRSDQLLPEEIGGPYRFFHIDGGHLAEEALLDLRLAAPVLHDAGVIAIDDPFRPEWPGVTEALVRFLDECNEFVAVALAFNKLVICKRRARALYDEALAHPWDRFSSRVWAAKQMSLVGSPVQIFTIPMERQIADLDQRVAWALWLRSALWLRLRRALPWVGS
jgi:Methyltransferase domain